MNPRNDHENGKMNPWMKARNQGKGVDGAHALGSGHLGVPKSKIEI